MVDWCGVGGWVVGGCGCGVVFGGWVVGGCTIAVAPLVVPIVV